MKIKKPWRSERHLRPILIFLVLAFFLLIPSGVMLADSNAPTVTFTPEPTNTPTQQPPTQTQPPLPEATNTSIPVIATETDESSGAIAIITPKPENSSGGMSTLNRFLLVVLGVTVVIVIGVIVYIFINQTRGGGLGAR